MREPNRLLGSPYNFQRTVLPNGQEYYVNPFIDYRRAIEEASTSPVVEVAGPTSAGYQSLQGVRFRTKPIITNRSSATRYVGGSTNPADFPLSDRQNIDIVADAKQLPFTDESLGVIMASCLPKVNIFDDSRNMSLEQMHGILASAAAELSQGNYPASEVAISPRVGFWVEAARTLKRGGCSFTLVQWKRT